MFKAKGGSVRAGILMDRNFAAMLGAIMISDFTSRDQVGVHVKIDAFTNKKIDVILCSLYLPHKDSDTTLIKADKMIKKELENLVTHCNEKKIHLLMVPTQTPTAPLYGDLKMVMIEAKLWVLSL